MSSKLTLPSRAPDAVIDDAAVWLNERIITFAYNKPYRSNGKLYKISIAPYRHHPEWVYFIDDSDVKNNRRHALISHISDRILELHAFHILLKDPMSSDGQ